MAAAVLIVPFVCALAAAGLSRAMWGYYVWPPSVIRDDDHILQASFIQFDGSSWRSEAVEPTEPPRSAVFGGIDCCPEDRLRSLLMARVPKMPDQTLQRAWRLSSDADGMARFPKVSDGYRLSAKTWVGVGAAVERNGREYVAIARHSGEVADDRHAYVEELFEVRGSALLPVGRVAYYFDFAGVEFLTFASMAVTLMLFATPLVATTLCRSRIV